MLCEGRILFEPTGYSIPYFEVTHKNKLSSRQGIQKSAVPVKETERAWQSGKDTHLLRHIAHPKPIHQGQHDVIERSRTHLRLTFAQGDIAAPVEAIFNDVTLSG